MSRWFTRCGRSFRVPAVVCRCSFIGIDLPKQRCTGAEPRGADRAVYGWSETRRGREERGRDGERLKNARCMLAMSTEHHHNLPITSPSLSHRCWTPGQAHHLPTDAGRRIQGQRGLVDREQAARRGRELGPWSRPKRAVGSWGSIAWSFLPGPAQGCL